MMTKEHALEDSDNNQGKGVGAHVPGICYCTTRKIPPGQ